MAMLLGALTIFSLNNSVGEVGLMLFFGGVGYLLRKFDYEAAPLVLAMVLGPMMENALRQSLIMANGSAGIFFTRPISLGVFLLVLALLVLPMLPRVKKKREVIAEIAE